MTTILITNDDGVGSPLLPLLVERLKSLGTVRMAVPAREQSWMAKAISRFGTVGVERRDEFGIEAYAVAGTPADCVNLGVHSLFSGKPDWLVSGINIGRNVGLSFLLNSGTVGAAIEGALLGIPALAFSQHLPPEVFRQWSEEGRIDGLQAVEQMERAVDWSARILKAAIIHGLPGEAGLLNVNLPKGLSDRTPVRWSRVGDHRYGALFEQCEGGYRHSYAAAPGEEPGRETDWGVLESGAISITPINPASLGAEGGPSFPIDQ